MIPILEDNTPDTKNTEDAVENKGKPNFSVSLLLVIPNNEIYLFIYLFLFVYSQLYKKSRVYPNF